MNVLMTILYILLFVFCLSLLIMIHELGHFTAAKIFKVYVQEYSIGFGPALVHVKRKNGETYFSLRCIPFGGYVSMYGEDSQLEDGEVIDKSRSLDGIRRWKRAIIMVAGVFMNAILALTIFFIRNVTFSDQQALLYYAEITENSKASAAGLKTLDILIYGKEISDLKENNSDESMLILDTDSVITYNDETSKPIFAYINTSKITDFKKLNLNYSLAFFETKLNADNLVVVDFSKPVSIDATVKNVFLNLTTGIYNKNNEIVQTTKHALLIEKGEDGKSLEDFGYSFYLYTRPPYSFFKAIGQSFVDFGKTSMIIGETLATLFKKDTISGVGGIVAMGFETTSILKKFGWGKFLYIWGALSVNLAIINLLPFPGLDGWQLLVIIIEGISRKKIPDKVKRIVSLVGLGLLFTLMIALVIKDIITYIL